MRQRPQFAHSGRQARGLAPQPGGENQPQGQQHRELRASLCVLGKALCWRALLSDTGFE